MAGRGSSPIISRIPRVFRELAPECSITLPNLGTEAAPRENPAPASAERKSDKPNPSAAGGDEAVCEDAPERHSQDRGFRLGDAFAKWRAAGVKAVLVGGLRYAEFFARCPGSLPMTLKDVCAPPFDQCKRTHLCLLLRYWHGYA